MPDDHPLTLRQADQARTDFAAIESDLNFMMDRIAALPTRRELARLALVIMFAAAVLGIVGIEAFWRYVLACGS
jgi:hypothetical protein